MSGFELTEEELKIFLQEAYEQLEVLEQGLLTFERDAIHPDLVQEIFRAAHTLKGGAGAAGFTGMERLTHVLESLLDEVRNGERDVDVDLIDHMLEGVDLLRQSLTVIETGGDPDEVDTGDLLARLQGMLGEEDINVSSAPASGRSQQANPPGGDQDVVHWHVRVSDAAPLPSIRLYQALLILEEAGHVLSSQPDATMLEQGDEEYRSLDVSMELHASPESVRAQLAEVGDLVEVSWSGSTASEDKEPVPPADDRTPDDAEKPRAASSSAESRQRRPGGVLGGSGLAPSVRVDVAVLDRLMNLVGELVIDRTRLLRLVSLDATVQMLQEELEQVSGHLSRITTDLQDTIMRARMIPLDNLFRKFPRMIRDVSHQLGKDVNFEMSGEDTELDRSVIEQIGDPLMHLLRNAVDHGLEMPEERVKAGKPAQGRVHLKAYHQENHIFIEVSDDGRGIDRERVRRTAVERGFISEEQAQKLDANEALELILTPGFTTAKEVSSISGRGVGLDVVRKNIERVNGQLTLESTVGEGTTWRIKLPLTLAIVQALLVQIAGGVYAIPISSVTEAFRAAEEDIEAAHGWRMIRMRGEVIPLIDPGEVWGSEYSVDWEPGTPLPIVVLQAGAAPLALMVDRLLGEQEVVIKSLGPIIGEVPGISGASILGDGSVSLIIDVVGLSKEVRQRAADRRT